MGSPVSLLVANLYMEDFECRALSTAPTPPNRWNRYVDDTFVEIQELAIQNFTQHINSFDSNIRFTMEPETDSKLPFLDTCVHIKSDGSTKVTIYRKPTHTDHYLNFGSNHHLAHKRSVARTLCHRIDQVITEEEDRETELHHVKKRSHCQRLISLKDKTPDLKKCGLVYQMSCDGCEDTYTGETARTLQTRYREHTSRSAHLTAVGEHISTPGHGISVDNVKIIAREDDLWKRKISEAVEIRRHHPHMNRDGGYELAHVYDRLLLCDQAWSRDGSREGLINTSWQRHIDGVASS
ncbi:uncharacterized protein LOC119740058 [Patiria miniata]|uniref:Helix-turn-helix domain-containing protein n=1 Tax=Patiria miniata TaxID=46514 RepID=A0A914B4I4_PATMI|nr:uncharacterized protein LOC119740058 [Patiria miniata]